MYKEGRARTYGAKGAAKRESCALWKKDTRRVTPILHARISMNYRAYGRARHRSTHASAESEREEPLNAEIERERYFRIHAARTERAKLRGIEG